MSISSQDLDHAFEILHNRWQEGDIDKGWDEVKRLSQYGTRFLRITRRLETADIRLLNVVQQDDQADEDDEEELRPVSGRGTQQHVATYDIVHSPSYQVPVLYLSIRGLHTAHRPTIDEVYELLVPKPYKPQMKAVGVIGALSLTDHPVNGLPAYFVHPCRTREVMETLLDSSTIKPEGYIALWIGMVGASVGLNVPVELAKGLGSP